jgi:hypothetical protein
MSILNTTNTPVGISFALLDPTNSDNLSAGYPLSHEWFNEETGDKFYHKFDGVWVKYENSSTSALTEVTYDELVTLVGASSLVPGRTYLLTDYETVYTQPESGETISSGVIEPLYLTAVDVNKLNNVCKSELYPEDIVYYEITGVIDSNYGPEGFTKGKIYRRIDTIANNDIGSDWRHVKYRRWAMKVENPWTIGNSYNVGSIVDDGGNIYICINDIADSQSLSDSNWFLYPATNGEYAGTTLSGSNHSILGNNIYVSIDLDDHQDFYLFDFDNGYYIPEYIYNNKIENYYLNNNVIKSPHFYNNTISDFRYNHIKSAQFTNNSGKQIFHNNLLGDSNFYYNDFLGSFVENIVTNSTPFRVNTFSEDVNGNDFHGDMTGNQMSRTLRNYITNFNDNTISNSFSDNVLRSPWQYNICTIGVITNCKSSGDNVSVNYNSFSTFNTNIIKDGFYYNRLGGYVYNNTFNGEFLANEVSGEEFLDNTFLGVAERNIIGSQFNTNTIGDSFDFNTIGVNFTGNTVGESFRFNNIGAGNSNWTFRSNLNHLTILNEINGSGRNIPYIPGTYDKTIRLSNGVLKCDYVDEHSDIIFQDDNTGPTFTFRSDLEDFRLYVDNMYLPVSGIDAITPFIVDWGDVVNPLIEDVAAAYFFGITHTYSGKLTTDAIEVAVIGEYIRNFEINNYEVTEFALNSNIPQYLQVLDIENNLLTSFDTTNLPNSLQSLGLGNNLLTSFDPSVALPSSLLNLYLGNNQLTSFNPSLQLPSSLQFLDLSNNQLDTTEVNNTLILLNTTYTTVGSKTFTLTMSPPATPDGAGLAAKGELEAKGYTVNTD